MRSPVCSRRSARPSTPATGSTSGRSRSRPRSRPTAVRTWSPRSRPRRSSDWLPLSLRCRWRFSAGWCVPSGPRPGGPRRTGPAAGPRSHRGVLRGAPTLTEIPVDTPPGELTARHPGYDARTAQRDPNTVFPLELLRDLAGAGEVQLAPTHYAFVGATSQVRLRERVAPEWAQRLLEARVGAALLVAT